MPNKICPIMTAGRYAKSEFTSSASCVSTCALWDEENGQCGLKRSDAPKKGVEIGE